MEPLSIKNNFCPICRRTLNVKKLINVTVHECSSRDHIFWLRFNKYDILDFIENRDSKNNTLLWDEDRQSYHVWITDTPTNHPDIIIPCFKPKYSEIIKLMNKLKKLAIFK